MKTNDKETEKAFEELVAICERLGWNVAIPDFDSGKENIDGLIIGTDAFIKEIFEETRAIEEAVSASH
jgi:hypothetical protein